jgi:hypothetical protein
MHAPWAAWTLAIIANNRKKNAGDIRPNFRVDPWTHITFLQTHGLKLSHSSASSIENYPPHRRRNDACVIFGARAAS